MKVMGFVKLSTTTAWLTKSDSMRYLWTRCWRPNNGVINVARRQGAVHLDCAY